MIRTLTIASAALLASGAAHAGCPPEGYDHARLEALKAADFALPETERDAFALALADCLSDPDPFLRDEVGYAAFAHLLRADQLSDDTRRTLTQRLQQQLATPDGEGFAQPFAALVLSELARADRLRPFLSDSARSALVVAGARYVAETEDYRGFTEGAGWRHAIAHGADLLMQLAAHPGVNGDELHIILTAAGARISTDDGHFYIYGEGERLARVVLVAARRNVLDQAFWDQWFEHHTSAGPLAAWDEAFSSQIGLAHRHNVMAFLLALYANVDLGGDAYAALRPGVEAALRRMP